MRENFKKKGLSLQLHDLEINHHWSIDKPFDFSDEQKQAEKFINDAGKAIGKGAEDLGNGLLKVGQLGYDSSIGLGVQAVSFVDKQLADGKLDVFSGKIISDSKNAGNFLGDLGKGHEVESNLKSGARLGIVAGTTIATAGVGSYAVAGTGLLATQRTAGLSDGSWGQLLSAGIASVPNMPNILKGLVNNIFNPPEYKSGPQYYADSNPDTVLYDTKNKLIPIIIIATITVGGIIIIMSSKKKRNKK